MINGRSKKPSKSDVLSFFWPRFQLTIESPLPDDVVQQRLSALFPRFAVPSLTPLPRIGFTLSKYYLGNINRNLFVVAGPRGFGAGRGLIHIKGLIVPAHRGSSIQLTIYAIGAAGVGVLWMIGIVVALSVAIINPQWLLRAILFAIVWSAAWAVTYGVIYRQCSQAIQQLSQCLRELLSG